MSKYPCDNWSWSLRRCDPKLPHRHDANKENREPISPLSRLAERVDDSRRWAPIPDRWHNHCEWLVNHHRKLRKRFRRTTANDRLAGVLTTLKCTRERRRGSDEDESVIGSGSRRKRLRSEVEYPELQPESTWLGSVHPELFQKNSPSPSKVDPFPDEDDEMEVESRKPAREPNCDDGDAEFTKPSGSGESIAERADSSTVTAIKDVSRSPSPVVGNFEPDDFRTSTPTTHEKSRRDARESCSTFHRDSAWKDYVMSHDPILFRSYIDTQYPKKSWRYSHQKLAARLGGKYRRSSSGRIRKPPTPKSLRISWNSLDDVVQNEGILRSPLHLLPVLPGDATPPLHTISDHSIDVEGLSSNNSHADADVSDVIGDEIRAIRKDCTQSHQPADDSYLASDEKDDEGGVVDPSELSDISLGEDEEKSTDKHGYELDQVSSDDDIDDICRIVDKELIHDDYHPDDILTEISFDILDDLEVDSKYPPNYFRAGFADRAVRRRKMKKATSIINGLDPQARSFRPRYTHEEDIADQRIVTFADRENSDQNQDKEQTEDVCGGGGTKFYPSDVRFSKKERLLKDRETPKDLECKNAKSEAVIIVPVPIPVKKVDPKREKQKKVQESDSLKSEESEIKEENGDSQQQSPKEETYKAVESEPPVLKTETEHVRDGDKSERTSTIKPIAKGKAKRQVAHKIPVVMGRRPGKPSQIMGNSNRDDGGRSVSRIPTAGGDDDNGCVVSTRIPQLRRVKIRKDEANDEGKVDMEPSSDTSAGETIRTDVDVYDNIVTDPTKNVAIEAKGHMVPAGTENSIQPHSLRPDTSIRNIDMSQSRHAALMKQRLALLKESHGNGPMREAGPMNFSDRVQEQHDSQGTFRGGQKVEMGHRDAELPDVNNNRFVNSVSQGKINLAPTFANAESNNGIDKGKRISDYAPGDKQSKVSGKKVHQAKENGPENMMNAERAPPLPSEQNEARRSGTNPLSETGRGNHPPQPLFQNPPQRFQHPHNMNPSVHPSMHPHLHAIPGNAPLYHQHPPDQPRPFNPGLSAYHHHQMALRAAAMHYYSQQRHMALQRHPGIQPPGFFPAHRHPMNMHPGCRPEWNNMPGPGPPH